MIYKYNKAIKMRSLTMSLFFIGCFSSAPIYANEIFSRSYGLIVNAGNGNYFYYNNGRVKEFFE